MNLIASFRTTILLFLLPLTLQGQDNILEQLEEIAIIDQKIMMPMRDGIRLVTDIFRPRTDKEVPVLFFKTPYNFNSWGNGEMRTRYYRSALEAVERGYAYVIQNERGRYFSQGE